MLYTWEGKLLIVDGKLAADSSCCCGGGQTTYCSNCENGVAPLLLLITTRQFLFGIGCEELEEQDFVLEEYGECVWRYYITGTLFFQVTYVAGGWLNFICADPYGYYLWRKTGVTNHCLEWDGLELAYVGYSGSPGPSVCSGAPGSEYNIVVTSIV